MASKDTVDKLDMALDDIIQQEHRGSGMRGRGRGGVQKRVAPGRFVRRGGLRGRGTTRGRGGRTLGAGQAFTEPQLDARGKWMKDTRATPVRRRVTSVPQPRPRQSYRHVMTGQQRQLPQPTRRPPPEDKLFLANLEYRVSDHDLLELFSQVGPLRSVRVHYDKSGRSIGTGEVTFEIPTHASIAEKRFNGVLIDSKPLVIQRSGSQLPGQNSGPTKLSSGITVVDPDERPTAAPSTARKTGDVSTVRSLKSAVVAAIAPEQSAFRGGAGHSLRSSITRSGMYSDRMDIG